MENYDSPYGQWRGADLQVASGWQRFWYGGLEPAWMDTREFDRVLGCNCWVEKIEGSTSQMVVATEPYTAGILQQVDGLTPGVGYGFHAAMLTIFETSAGGSVDGTMIKQIGLDTTGGTDPQAPTVAWSEPDDHDEGPWAIDQRIAAFAQSSKATVFVRVISPFPTADPSLMNISFLDSAILAETPHIEATSPFTTESPVFAVRWDNVTPGPGASDIKWIDVQWLDEAEGVWHDWLSGTGDVEAEFSGELGHVYRFRARAFQKYPNGAHLYSPYRPDGDTRTIVGKPAPPPPPKPEGPVLAGEVLDPQGRPVAGANIQVKGTDHAATSGPGGRYAIELPNTNAPQTLLLSHPYWTAPSPVYGVVLPPTGTVSVTWSLLPRIGYIVNGEFEDGLSSWYPISTGLSVPQVVSQPVRTGKGALGLVPPGQPSASVGVSQTMTLTRVWEPGLSFWYRPVVTTTEDAFRVVLTLVTETISRTLPSSATIAFSEPPGRASQAATAALMAVSATPPVTGPLTSTVRLTTTYNITPSLETDGWQHFWHPAGPPDTYVTGTLSVRFEVWHQDLSSSVGVYIDQAALGASPGGPYRAHLPYIAKHSNQVHVNVPP
jgi:hypothetical protein